MLRSRQLLRSVVAANSSRVLSTRVATARVPSLTGEPHRHCSSCFPCSLIPKQHHGGARHFCAPRSIHTHRHCWPVAEAVVPRNTHVAQTTFRWTRPFASAAGDAVRVISDMKDYQEACKAVRKAPPPISVYPISGCLRPSSRKRALAAL
eukprot:508742-Rhodomonas_salina.2